MIRDEDGSMLLIAIILLGVIITAGMLSLKSIETNMKEANTGASRATLQELTSVIQLGLASTDTCAQRLQLLGPCTQAQLSSSAGCKFSLSFIQGSSPTQIAAPTTGLTFLPGSLRSKTVLGSSPYCPNLGAVPPNSPAPPYACTGPLGRTRFLADAVISATRSTGHFGSQTIEETFPIMIELQNPPPAGKSALTVCSTRTIYAQTLKGNTHSSLDCLDRGGTPVYEAPANEAPYWTCRFPITPLLAICGKGGFGSSADPKYPSGEGWTDDQGNDLGPACDGGSCNASYCL